MRARKVYKRCPTCRIVMRVGRGRVVCGARRRDGGRCDGRLEPDGRCNAVLFHGPGHQSTTRCELEGRHAEHRAEYRHGVARWRGMEATTGYFDEAP